MLCESNPHSVGWSPGQQAFHATGPEAEWGAINALAANRTSNSGGYQASLERAGARERCSETQESLQGTGPSRHV